MTTAAVDSAIAAFAAEVGAEGTVAVEGARSAWDAGGPLDAGTRLVSAPAGMVEHQPEEMTVRVRAGTPVAELHAALGSAGQRSALAERGGTVGGAIAVGRDHLEVLGRGRVRDALLQVRYVSADGRVVTGGGPTVKNVSGYDLPRLMTGSLGTLGLIAEVLLRTNPLPPVSRWLRAQGPDPAVVLGALWRPGAVLCDGGSVWVLLEGHRADVADAAGALARLGDWVEVEGPPALGPHRWSLEPSAAAALRTTDTLGPWVASVGVGTVWAAQPQPRREAPAALAALRARVKSAFDPGGRLNPGRVAG